MAFDRNVGSQDTTFFLEGEEIKIQLGTSLDYSWGAESRFVRRAWL